MELARRYLGQYGNGLGAFLALERALLRRYLNRGGTPVEFSERLLPAIRRKYGTMLGDAAPIAPGEARLRG